MSDDEWLDVTSMSTAYDHGRSVGFWQGMWPGLLLGAAIAVLGMLVISATLSRCG